MDSDSFEASGLVVVEAQMLLEPCEHEFYDGAFSVDAFQAFWSMCFEVFGYSENVMFVSLLVSRVWYRGCDVVALSRLSEIAAGVLAVGR